MPCNTPWVGYAGDTLFLTSGQFESTLKDSQYVGGIDTAPNGICFDGINTQWVGDTENKLFLNEGIFLSTLLLSEPVGSIDTSPKDSSWDGTNTLWTGVQKKKIFLVYGEFENTLITSLDVNGFDTAPKGVSFDGSNTPWVGYINTKLFLNSGEIEGTLKTSLDVSGIDINPFGISFDGTNTPWSGRSAVKLYLGSGQFESTLKTSLDVSGIDSAPLGISVDYVWGRIGGVSLSLFEGITSLDIDPEIIIDPVELEATVSLSMDIFSGVEIDCSAGFNLTSSFDIDIGLSSDVSFSATSSIDCDPTFTIPDCILSAIGSISLEYDYFTLTDASRIYIFTLTGSADSVSDVTIPISSFQTRIKSGDPSYLSVIIPGLDYLSYINARLNGDLVLRIGYKRGSTILLTEIVSQVSFDNIRYDEGANSASITLDGYKSETYTGKPVTLTEISYKSLTSGKFRLRCKPDLYLKPGDTATDGVDSFIVSSITFSVSAEQETYEVAE